MQTQHHQQFAQLHQAPNAILLLPNAWDAASAKIFEASGARAVATSSASLAWACGYADGGALPPDELLDAVARITRVLRVPLTVDMEDGYSDSPAEVGRLAAELVAVGAAGINLEDGSGAPDLLADKIKAIRSALKGAPLFINARTDVYLRKLKVEGTPAQASVERLKLYQQAGADGAFVPGLTALPEVTEITAAISLPLNVMAMPGLPPIGALQAAGARRVSVGPAPFQVAYEHARTSVEALLKQDLAPLLGDKLDYSAMNTLLSSPR
ncbi:MULTISPECIES: isocitrate lyase/phosphoenolpyruvate mutase family protein [unclassified Polaromonas]|uniref:isocitrate lyase/PEP mutase family protein n=1 Tax=unclassified Polaromonas TaxID=2638319 RepID=UPI000F07D213|nr:MULTISPECIES: isocitrate lyase/phosphoenolpyruvate mutase family protein [unclassified Polaromonas]AYQ28318.1 isocitrate lyase/phosphoenolpyruvate mutase family protein [Polaromonas sp. SP1]QGJ20562.1 isocitrate lyase/phosphoenolpyruvate mutase family protein [Polaromonas sp. Pch-P]